MTATFAVAGACEVATALALRPAAMPGRLILAAADTASVLVAANPEHVGGSFAHGLWAAVTFTALTAWAAGAWRRGPSAPWGLRPSVSVTAIGLLLGEIQCLSLKADGVTWGSASKKEIQKTKEGHRFSAPIPLCAGFPPMNGPVSPTAPMAREISVRPAARPDKPGSPGLSQPAYGTNCFSPDNARYCAIWERERGLHALLRCLISVMI
jgi:hypothetical protein